MNAFGTAVANPHILAVRYLRHRRLVDPRRLAARLVHRALRCSALWRQQYRARQWPSAKLYAEELGGPDRISLNIYAPPSGYPALRPCEMLIDKVTAFVLGALPEAIGLSADEPQERPAR